MRQTRFRITYNDDIKAYLLDKQGNLLTSIYDSGYTRISQVKQALLNKCCNPPKGVDITISNVEKYTYYTTR